VGQSGGGAVAHSRSLLICRMHTVPSRPNTTRCRPRSRSSLPGIFIILNLTARAASVAGQSCWQQAGSCSCSCWQRRARHRLRCVAAAPPHGLGSRPAVLQIPATSQATADECNEPWWRFSCGRALDSNRAPHRSGRTRDLLLGRVRRENLRLLAFALAFNHW
jgi:hypothetical protein